MKSLPTSLPGVQLLELDSFGDARGRFMELYRRERYHELGITTEFVQDNYSTSTRNTLRGLHHQLHQPQGKLVVVARGEIFDVAVDIRRDSSTFKKWFGAHLSADNHLQMWIPPGFAHGFLVTSDTADVIYKCTTTYAPADERSIRYDDPDLAIDWPLAGSAPILSARDQAAPLLASSELP